MLALSAKEKERILKLIKPDLEKAKSAYNEREDRIITKRKIYDADPEFYKQPGQLEKLSEKNSITIKHIKNSVKAAMPDLLKILASKKNLSFVGRGGEDTYNAQVIRELVDYVMDQLNRWFVVSEKWMEDSCIEGLGWLKVTWIREYKVIKKQQEITYYPGYTQELDALQNDENFVGLISNEPIKSGLNRHLITYKYRKLVKNFPKIENLLSNEVLYDVTARDVEEVSLIAHRKRTNYDYIKRKIRDGIYYRLSDEEIDMLEAPEYTQYEKYLNSELEEKTYKDDDPRREVTIYEIYTKIDLDRDGFLEDVIVTMSGNVILRVEENEMERHPFFMISPDKAAARIDGDSFVDMLEDLQKLKIAILRIVTINLIKNLDAPVLYNEQAFYQSDFDQGLAQVRVRPGYRLDECFRQMEMKPTDPFVGPMLELIEAESERSSPTVRYNQGVVGGDALNDTATGISMIMGSVSKKIEVLARRFAEIGYAPLLKYLVKAIFKYMDDAQIYRITNKQLQRIDGQEADIDIVVNSGLGVGTQETNVRNYTMLLNMFNDFISTGVATQVHKGNVARLLIEEMGYKNAVPDFINSREEIEGRVEMQKQAAQAQMMAQQQAHAQAVDFKHRELAAKHSTENQKMLARLLEGTMRGRQGTANPSNVPGGTGETI